MPLPGGQADKFGNRYEDRWTVLALVEVMDERYDSIRLEPPGAEGEGIEFWLRKDDHFEYHQVKRQDSAEGRWTIKALGQRQVLSHFFYRLNDPTATCVFVSIQDAYQLRELAERVSQSASFDEFGREYLKASQHSTNFDSLLNHWSGCSRQDAYEKLRRVHVKTIDEATLQTTLEWRVETLVDDVASATVTDILAQFALDNVGCELTAHDIWRHLESRNCRRRDWAKDTHVIAAVERMNTRYLDALQGETINGKMILRQEAQQAVEKLTSSAAGRGILLTGEAGAGKSCVLAQITSALGEQGWPLLAFRVDRMDLALQPEEFGKKNALPGSPAHVLAAVAQGRDCALVIDQLDAVSLASGRHPDFFYCLDEIIRQSLIHPRMRLVLGCRKFDIDNDHRLRKLTEKAYGIDVIQVSRLSHDTVRQVVNELGLDASRLNSRQLDLLSVPLHLNLLAGVASDTTVDALSFETVKDLYDHFWNEKQKLIRQHLGDSVAWTQMLDTLCDYLSNRQVLSAPVGILDECEQKDVSAMVSEHVLTLDNGRYAFFHEGFFDYAFARRFAAKSQGVIEFLLGQEQHLFRRAQLRQILLHERENDRARYLADLHALITHPRIRFHLKQVVFALLTTFADPTEQEWKIIAPLLDDPANPLKVEVWILLNSSAAWFSLLDSFGLLEKWLAIRDDDECINRAVRLLMNAQKTLPDRVAELVEPYVGASDEWNNRLVYLMQWTEKGAGRRFFDLLLRLIDEGILDEARGPIAMNSDFWMLTYSLPKERPDWAAEVIGHYCNRHLERSLAIGNPNPFDFPAAILDSQHADRYLSETAEGAPLRLVEQVLPFMLRVMELTIKHTEEPPWRDEVWRSRHVDGGYSFKHALLIAMEKALSLLAESEPDSFAPIAAQLRQLNFETAQFLLIRAYAANGERFADEAADYLCDHPARLMTGYSDDSHWATRLLIQAITPFCSDENLLRLEDTLLGYYTRWERRVDGYRWRGFAQFKLLDGIAVSRQSERVKRRLGEWRRKFNRQTVEPPKGIVGGLVGSPIPQEAAAKMTDTQWLRAIAKHHTDDLPFRIEGDDLVGGAHTLANVLEHCAKKDPIRFTKLACQFPDMTNPCYFDAVLRGVADASLEPALIGELCERCHQLPHRPCGQGICWLVRKQSTQPLSKLMLDIVAWYATEDPNPQQELWRTDAGDGRMRYNGEIEAHAINTVRGSAAEAVASLLFDDRNRLTQFLPVLEKMVNDSSIAVRSCVAEALTAMLNCNRALAVTLFLQLCETEDDLLQTRGVERFLRYGLQTHYEALAPVLGRMLDCDLEKANIAGARLACLTALSSEVARALVEKCLVATEAYRIGTAQVFAANLRSARYRAYCEAALKRLFNDPSEKVRAEASRCFSHFKNHELSAYTDLIKDFVQSEAFIGHHRSLFHALKETTGKLPDITCVACERFIEIAGTTVADIQTHAASDSYQATELIVRAYRQHQDEAIQARCLDLIDRLAQARALGLDRAVSEFER